METASSYRQRDGTIGAAVSWVKTFPVTTGRVRSTSTPKTATLRFASNSVLLLLVTVKNFPNPITTNTPAVAISAAPFVLSQNPKQLGEETSVEKLVALLA